MTYSFRPLRTLYLAVLMLVAFSLASWTGVVLVIMASLDIALREA